MSENLVPVYSVDVIVNFYRTDLLTCEEAKHFTKSDLAPSPKPEAVQLLYMRVLYQLFRFRPECHSMVPLVENIHPECHEGASAVISVYERMRQFLSMCFVYDFSLNDLLAPKRQRTLMILSAIMNFFQFRKQQINEMSEKQFKIRTDLNMQQTYTKGIQQAEKKIEMLTTIPPEQQAEAAKLDAAISELQAATANLCNEGKAKSQTSTEWKSRITEKTQKLAQVKMDINGRKEDITKLKSGIVESPEELQIQMERMRGKVNDIKSSIGQADEDLVELQNMVQRMNHTDMKIQKMYDFLQDLEINMNGCKQEHDENQQLISQNEKKQKELKNLCKEEEQMKRALDMKLDREAKDKIRRQKNKEIKKQHVDSVLGQCNQMLQKHGGKEGEISAIAKDIQHLKVEIQGLKDVCSTETKKSQAMYDSLSTAMDELDRRMEMSILIIKEDALKMLQVMKVPLPFSD
ncbi:kinetochore protein Nuf2 [Vanacampus margaritifer]